MKKLSFVKPLIAMSLAAVCALGIVGCSGGSSSSSASSKSYTGGVAATVNGVDIQEDTITGAIEEIRQSMGLTDEASWGNWMAQKGYTPESVREEILDSYIDQEIMKQKSEELGVSVDQVEVDNYVDQMKSNYDSDEAWQKALEQVGMTEQDYRDNIETALMSNALQEKVAEDAAEPSDKELLESAKSNLSSYDGAKKSSHILFNAGDEATAKEVLKKIKDGKLDFAEAAKTYSKDTSTSADGGNMGWDKLASLDAEYTEALKDLKKDQVSDLIVSGNGIQIIMCTDTFKAPKKLKKFSDLPKEFQDAVRDMLIATNASSAYYAWLDEQRKGADIKINDMPEGLPYVVNMDDYSADAAAGDGDVMYTVDEDGNLVPVEDNAVEEGAEDAAEGAEDEAEAAAEEAEEAEQGENTEN